MMLKLPECPHCGGRVLLDPESGAVTCRACGKEAAADEEDVKKINEVYARAKELMGRDTSAGYAEAIWELQSISLAADVGESLTLCQTKLDAMREKEKRQDGPKEDTDSGHMKLGIVILILVVLFFIAIIVGIAALVKSWFSGGFTGPAAVIAVVLVIVIAAALVFGKLRGN
ncbi:MAG: hypothetical protein IK104_09235 [Clostridia bacterium]|nr:hypothetical protein [Clostridia bacterium]